jgi:hypothetical protein
MSKFLILIALQVLAVSNASAFDPCSQSFEQERSSVFDTVSKYIQGKNPEYSPEQVEVHAYLLRNGVKNYFRGVHKVAADVSSFLDGLTVAGSFDAFKADYDREEATAPVRVIWTSLKKGGDDQYETNNILSVLSSNRDVEGYWLHEGAITKLDFNKGVDFDVTPDPLMDPVPENYLWDVFYERLALELDRLGFNVTHQGRSIVVNIRSAQDFARMVWIFERNENVARFMPVL